MEIKILAVGDICGEPGLDCLREKLKAFKEENNIGFCVVNGENANVVGITPKQANDIFKSGADVITLGNHTWTRTELRPYLDERSRIIRPANYAPPLPYLILSGALRLTTIPTIRLFMRTSSLSTAILSVK